MDLTAPILVVVFVIAGFILYFLPALIGWKKENHGAIFALNLFLGWTLIGWVVALVWACMSDSHNSLEILCAQCGQYSMPGSTFCTNCGQALAVQTKREGTGPPGTTKGRVFLAALFLLAIAIPARAQLCGPDVRHATKKVETKSELEIDPPKDRALIYVLDHYTESAFHLQIKISADREWIGIVDQGHSYFVVALAPGHHDLCMKMVKEVRSAVVDAEPGGRYFFQVEQLDPALRGMSPEDAAIKLKKCKRMIFWEKGRPEPKD